MNEIFESFKPTAQLYRDYAEKMQALSVEYHNKRLAEAFPATTALEEMVCVQILDARETPALLDRTLSAIKEAGVVPTKIIFDRLNFKFYLFI